MELEGTQSSDSCVHLNAVADTLKDNYQLVLAYYVTCIAKDAWKHKAADAFCRICGVYNRIHACLECAFFGCSDDIKDHAKENDHYFAVNVNHGCLFCFKCNDYVYNQIFEYILNDYQTEVRKINGSHYHLPWRPKVKEIACLKDKIKKISDDSFIGLRGILNIGAGCYVNSVLQVFIHNPLMRDYFLSDKHKCFKKQSDTCLMCEMFLLFQEFYSGKTSSFDTTDFFKVLRKCGIKNPGEEEEDTFEFFLVILTWLEKSCQEEHKIDDCNCMVHRTFYGINQSSRECSNASCKFSSALPLEHFVDILLDLNESDSLEESLKKKCMEKELISDFPCERCQKTDTTYKHTVIKKLPSVICFRKNINPSKPKNKSFKFENSIDMSEYLISKGDIESSNKSHVSNSYTVSNRYYLFGVISHRKVLDGGHYVAIVKQRKNRWFECNDEKVKLISFDEVVASEPYLLFYYKPL